jgi:hypothetical protein
MDDGDRAGVAIISGWLHLAWRTDFDAEEDFAAEKAGLLMTLAGHRGHIFVLVFGTFGALRNGWE